MQLEVKQTGEIRVLIFEGNLDTNTSPEAESTINGLIEDGAQQILVNFEKLNFISSAGLRVLLSTAKKLKGTGGVLKICGLNPTVQEVFDISGFGSILSVAKSEADALSAF
ncbi:MAG: STAS domain-containing protein [Pseudomonadales bacterium]